jgi:HK97 family phage major capsid protein
MTLTEILEKRRERKALFEKAVAIRDKAKEEKRKMTSSEEEEFNRMMDDVDAMLKEIEREERILAVQDGTEKRTHGLVTEDQENQRQELNQEEYRQAFLTWLRNGVNGLTPEQRALMQKGFQDLPAEARALAAGTPAAGGYTVPEDFYKKLTDAELWYGGMRESRATIIQSSTGADLPMPTDDDSSNKGAIIAENTQLGEQDITFGQKVLKAYMYTSKIVRVSFQLLQDSAFDLESWLARKLGIRIARITNEHFTVGTGTSQPEGVVTGASEGKVGDTGQTTSVTFADLVDLMHAVDRAYRTNAQWMFHDSSLKALKKMEDSQNRPLWLPGIAVREPDTILGKPYIVNNDIPEMGVDAKSILFGDFSAYCIRDVLGVQLLRLVERYADFLQVGFLAFSRHDGGLLDAGTHPIKYYQNSST